MMIDQNCFTKDWILRQRNNLGSVDPTLLEKTILAFEILGRLVTCGLPFVFKGGTCLLLLLKEFRRLSIDVDIVCNLDEQQLIRIFDAMIAGSPFSRWAEDPRNPSHIPKKHFKFFFASQINQREDYILLDVLRSEKMFPVVQNVPINFAFIQTNERVSITVPTIDSMIGDKLTAFAPRTIGVPLQTERSMQIVKQLFDLGELFLLAVDIAEISASYNIFAQMENSYRKTNFTRQDTLRDTLDACFLISQIDLRHSIQNEITDILRRGIRQIGSHVVGVPFGLPQAKIAASRVAFLASILANNKIIEIRKKHYSRDLIENLQDTTISGERAILNRLKFVSPEAYYYWHLIDRIPVKTET